MAATALKPIPTRYKGYHFRSRLEARWAVFFDAMGMRWEYEPQGFDLPAGKYLPDFKVRWHVDTRFGVNELIFWFEVKPDAPAGCEESDDTASVEVLMARDLSAATRLPVLFGTPQDFDVLLSTHQKAVAFEDANPYLRGFSDGPPGSVPFCWQSNVFSIQWWDRLSAVDQEVGYMLTYNNDPRNYGAMPAWVRAVCAARSARFEYGECGAT